MPVASGADSVRLPRLRLTVRRMMVAAAVVAACLSFAARADRLRTVASEQVHQSSARLVRAHGKSTAEDWREYQRAQDDLLKADFLESFGIVVAILVTGVVAVLAVRPKRPVPPRGEDATGA